MTISKEEAQIESSAKPKRTSLKGKEPILQIVGLCKWFNVAERTLLFSRNIGHIKAVDGIDLTVYDGEVLGLVGESGSGKSTVARCVVKLQPPTAGQIFYKDSDIWEYQTKEEKAYFRKSVQMIFQDPYSSLNPRRLVLDIVREGLDIHHKDMEKDNRNDRVLDLLKLVGLEEYHALRYSHEFSGGQRQRIGIARALILAPKLVLADEPVSALDVSVQASILNLMQDLQREFHLTMVFIAHDLSVVKHVSDRVAVMYLGKLVEVAETEELFEGPMHPYTISLMSAIPIPDPTAMQKRILLEGDIPSPINVPSGCRFHPRCFRATDICKEVEPEFSEVKPGRWTACHHAEALKVLEFANDKEGGS